MRRELAALPPAATTRRHFLGTYLRTTEAVGAAVEAGWFLDPDWVEAWDVAFARLYLDPLGADLAAVAPDHQDDDGTAADRLLVPRPWRIAFAAPAELPALRHVLLGLNAHINYDLPQALLAVIGDADFADPELMARRHADHERIDDVLTGRVAAEDAELGARRLRDRLLTPLNRLGTQRFLRESRRRVWHNTVELQRARAQGPAAYAARLGELEVLSAAKVADLLAPGQVLLRLAVAGFGVTLPPP